MAKQKVVETLIDQKKGATENKPVASLTLDDLKKLLKDKEDLKIVLENEYFKLQGQIQFLAQQIQTLEKR